MNKSIKNPMYEKNGSYGLYGPTHSYYVHTVKIIDSQISKDKIVSSLDIGIRLKKCRNLTKATRDLKENKFGKETIYHINVENDNTFNVYKNYIVINFHNVPLKVKKDEKSINGTIIHIFVMYKKKYRICVTIHLLHEPEILMRFGVEGIKSTFDDIRMKYTEELRKNIFMKTNN